MKNHKYQKYLLKIIKSIYFILKHLETHEAHETHEKWRKYEFCEIVNSLANSTFVGMKLISLFSAMLQPYSNPISSENGYFSVICQEWWRQPKD